jgi:sortase A
MKSPRRATARPGRRSASISRAGSFFFLAVGLFALGYAAYVSVDAHAYQAYEQAKFENVRSKEPAPPLVEGGVIGEIQVPRLQLKAIIVQGDSHTILRRAVGHVPETALPGTIGNVVLAGHRDTFFRPLRNIRLGDSITVQTSTGTFQYLVESTEVVPATAMEILNATPGHSLTLITCFPFDYIGPAPKRFVVRARELASPSTEPLLPR